MVELVFNDAAAAMFRNLALVTRFCVNFPHVNTVLRKHLPFSSIAAVRYEAVRTRSGLETRKSLSDVYKVRHHAKPFNEGPPQSHIGCFIDPYMYVDDQRIYDKHFCCKDCSYDLL